MGAAAISAVICVFAFHPSIGQNGREPTWAADYLWTRHPGWNNPLPEVFTETYLKTEAPTAPTFTPGCEKILAGGRGASSAWPVPCFPADTPIRCRGVGVWCYANREGAGACLCRRPGGERPAEIDEARRGLRMPCPRFARCIASGHGGTFGRTRLGSRGFGRSIACAWTFSQARTAAFWCCAARSPTPR